MRKNNSKMNKVLKVTYNTWYEIVVGFAKEFNKEYYEIENVLVSILSKDNINKIKRNTKYEENILEIANENISCIFREVSYDLSEVIHAQFISGLVNHAKYWAIGILYDIITGDEMVIKLLKAVNNNGSINNEKVWHKFSRKTFC